MLICSTVVWFVTRSARNSNMQIYLHEDKSVVRWKCHIIIALTMETRNKWETLPISVFSPPVLRVQFCLVVRLIVLIFAVLGNLENSDEHFPDNAMYCKPSSRITVLCTRMWQNFPTHYLTELSVHLFENPINCGGCLVGWTCTYVFPLLGNIVSWRG